ncbi:hydroxyisourate hydrolase [Domibacillus robiginosus]|uniref:hydroxyisourate hydrolase n=1 Tax=Domibacillus robiginosus TaxID=1071054 RepID=UPI00067DA6C3|nr:hydroxyisourate hydrolase [Domibacillus robiginosus]
MGGLTTHILDLTHGCPASQVSIELFELNGPEKRLLNSARTNSDGRLDAPLLSSDLVRKGEYELLFYIGDYFKEKGLQLSEPAFLEKVSVRIGLDPSSLHYHVPLLVSPWGYQVYRGS